MNDSISLISFATRRDPARSLVLIAIDNRLSELSKKVNDSLPGIFPPFPHFSLSGSIFPDLAFYLPFNVKDTLCLADLSRPGPDLQSPISRTALACVAANVECGWLFWRRDRGIVIESRSRGSQ
jgi:hypothetical protein